MENWSCPSKLQRRATTELFPLTRRSSTRPKRVNKIEIIFRSTIATSGTTHLWYTCTAQALSIVGTGLHHHRSEVETKEAALLDFLTLGWSPLLPAPEQAPPRSAPSSQAKPRHASKNCCVYPPLDQLCAFHWPLRIPGEQGSRLHTGAHTPPPSSTHRPTFPIPTDFLFFVTVLFRAGGWAGPGWAGGPQASRPGSAGRASFPLKFPHEWGLN